MRIKNFLVLHLLLMIYSLSEVFSKVAAKQTFLSKGFLACYVIIVAVLFLYAIGWQQIIKRMPLVTAYANKAVTTIWGTVWGILLFHELFSLTKLIGILFILAGILMFTMGGDKIDE